MNYVDNLFCLIRTFRYNGGASQEKEYSRHYKYLLIAQLNTKLNKILEYSL